MSRRGRALRMTVAGILLLGLAAVVDAFWIEPQWIEVTRHQIAAPVASPIKIAHLTDLHTRGLGRRERKLLALLEAEKPDVIVITGDTVANDGTPEEMREVLRRLRAPLGVWMVRGNWDIWQRVPDDASFYQSAGARLLLNAPAQVRDKLWLLGFDDASAGSPDLDKTLAGVPADAYRIALFHAPIFFDHVAGKSELALTGHTHGGQVRLPLLGPLWLPGGCGRYLAGWYEQSGSRMYVSRGIGTSILNARFFCRPELAIFTLQQTREHK